MESFKELKYAILNNMELVWNDPEPTEGANYLISIVNDLSEVEDDEDPRGYPILIQYGEGSEAEVLLCEIGYAKAEYYDIHVEYDGGGYSIGLLTGKELSDEEIKENLIHFNRFDEKGDSDCIDSIEGISEEFFYEWYCQK